MSESYIGSAPLQADIPTIQRKTYVCVGGETAFGAGNYTVGYLDVFLNGAKQHIGVDVIASDGTTMTFVVPCQLNDIVEYAYTSVSAPYDYYIKSQADALFVNTTSPTGSAAIPKGTTAQQDGVEGSIRYNTEIKKPEYKSDVGYRAIGAGATGGGTDEVFFEAGTNVTENYTLSAGKNALAVKQISVATGKTLTIPTGQALVVVGGSGGAAEAQLNVTTMNNQIINGSKNFTSPVLWNGADITGVGVGQTWQTVTRNGGTTYYNTTGKPIILNTWLGGTNINMYASISINGGAGITYSQGYASGGCNSAGSVTIPTNASYVVTYFGATTIVNTELR